MLFAISVGFALSMALIVFNYVRKAIKTKRISIYIFLIIGLMLLSLLVHEIHSELSIYKYAIIVFCCILCIDSVTDSQLSLKEARFIEFCFLVAVGAANFMYYFGGMDEVYYGSTKNIAFYFGNPNNCALWLATFFMFFVMCLFVEKNKWMKGVLLLAAASVVLLIDATGSRTSLLACIVMLAGALFIKFTKIKKLPRWVLVLGTVLPCVVFFVYMYVIMPNIDTFNKWFSFAISEGKGLDSRFKVWNIIAGDIKECFWFGKYTTYYNQQMHNSIMTVFSLFGAPFTVLVCAVFYNLLKKVNIVSQLVLLSIWFTGCFEASIFAGVAGMYLMVQIIPAVCETAWYEKSVGAASAKAHIKSDG